jgi:hypothetical protein
MEDEIAIRELSFGTLFKIVFWAGACVWILLAGIVVVLAFVAPGSIVVNGVRATSAGEAIGAAPIFLILGAIFTSIFAIVGVALLWLVGRFLPLGTINTRD